MRSVTASSSDNPRIACVVLTMLHMVLATVACRDDVAVDQPRVSVGASVLATSLRSPMSSKETPRKASSSRAAGGLPLEAEDHRAPRHFNTVGVTRLPPLLAHARWASGLADNTWHIEEPRQGKLLWPSIGEVDEAGQLDILPLSRPKDDLWLYWGQMYVSRDGSLVSMTTFDSGGEDCPGDKGNPTGMMVRVWSTHDGRLVWSMAVVKEGQCSWGDYSEKARQSTIARLDQRPARALPDRSADLRDSPAPPYVPSWQCDHAHSAGGLVRVEGNDPAGCVPGSAVSPLYLAVGGAVVIRDCWNPPHHVGSKGCPGRYFFSRWSVESRI